MKFNKYFPFALLYFFFNSLGLPFGLTYTAILSPFFYWWVLIKRGKEILHPFFLALLPFILVHFYLGVNEKAYLISLFNLATVYIFCQTFYTFLLQCRDKEKIFTRLLVLNFIFCLVAIPIYFTSYSDIFWIQQFLTEGVDNFRRLKLFTYEASYYATVFTPIFFFFLLQIILRQNRISAWMLLPMLLLPYLLSFSFGVIGAVMAAVIVTYFLYFKTLTRKKRVVNILALISLSVITVLVFLFLFMPDNPLFARIGNVFSGQDLSGQGRTADAFYFADVLLDKKSQVWGIGLGQVKILGAEFIRNYYLYPLDYTSISIPNATAETLTIFGWIGLTVRFLAEIILFIATRVWTNYFRLLLFIFIFIYQFTGSFITNLAEYVIWILAFTNVFTQFDVRNKSIVHAEKQLTNV